MKMCQTKTWMMMAGVLGLGASLDVSSAVAPQFVELQSDRASYEVGQNAVLTSHVRIQPSNPNYEVALEARFGGASIQIIRITETEAVSVTPLFAAPGAKEWKVDVYLQDRRYAAGLEATMAYMHAEICRIEELLKTETDPMRRELLIGQRNRNRAIFRDAQTELRAHRRKVETRVLTLDVAPAVDQEEPAEAPVENHPAIMIETDRAGGSYAIGEGAQFFVRVLTGFEGEDGPQEVVVQGWMEGRRIGGEQVGERDFIFTSHEFTVVCKKSLSV